MGGLTYMADHLFIDDTQDVEGKFIGWDYAHAGDYAGYYGDEGILADEKKWTTQEIFEEVKDACYQLKQLEEKSPADKMFEELGYKRTENGLHNVARYKKDDDNVIYFCEATSYSAADVHKSGEYCETCYGITMRELKAINKKCEELGWM